MCTATQIQDLPAKYAGTMLARKGRSVLPKPPWRVQPLVHLCAIVAIVGLLALHQLHRGPSSGRPRQAGPDQPRTIRFAACAGFANQRLALVYGALLAKRLGRAAVLPPLALSSPPVAPSSASAADAAAAVLPLSAVYDEHHLARQAGRAGVLVIPAEQAPPEEAYVHITLDDTASALAALNSYADTPHVTMDCPVFTISSSYVAEDSDTVWALLGALRLAPRLAAAQQALLAALAALPGGAAFNFLHLRVEDDWLAHCQRWETLQGDGVVRNNCLNGTFELGDQLASKGFAAGAPLYAAAHWPDTNAELVHRVQGKLQYSGYRLLRQPDLLPRGALAAPLAKEEAAAVDYYLALNSTRFIGNSVSTFSALLLLERRAAGRWASYYNGGNIPLAGPLPLYGLPWVFTYNSWSPEYDYMMRAAVRSGRAAGGLVPICLFTGNRSSAAYSWLVANQVRVIQHAPAWSSALLRLLAGHDNVRHSHLYAKPEMQVGTWLRIDLAILPQLEQYDYVLFTDADVYFRKHVSLEDFPLPLPAVVGMAAEREDWFPFNAGIMLMNLPRLRATYADFLAFILSNQHGLFFPGYGPGDQGAFNQFYERHVRAARLPQVFNAKPYHAFNADAFVVHFHGPKPHQYSAFVSSGECDFADMCEAGITGGYCAYYREWTRFYVRDANEPAGALAAACPAGLRLRLRSSRL